MNIGRVLVGGSAVVALAAGAGFVATVFSPSDLQAHAGEMCADSTTSRDFLMGMPLTNDGDHPIELSSARIRSLDDVTVNGTWVDPIDDSGHNIGSIVYTPEAIAEYRLSPVQGTIVSPGVTTIVVFRIMSLDGVGTARDFSVDYIGNYGMRHTRTAEGVFGFSRGRSESSDCSE